MKKKSKPKPRHRTDWEYNQEIISNCFWSYMATKNKMPSMRFVAEQTGLSEKSIERHKKLLNFKKHIEKLRCIEDRMAVIFVNKVSKSNNPNMWELYFNVTTGTAIKKQALDITSDGKEINQIPSAIKNATVEQLIEIIKTADNSVGKN